MFLFLCFSLLNMHACIYLHTHICHNIYMVYTHICVLCGTDYTTDVYIYIYMHEPGGVLKRHKNRNRLLN